MNKTWPLKSAPVEEIKLLQWIRDACQCRWKPCNYICTHIESYTYKWRINKQVDKKYIYIILPQQQDFGSIYLSTTSQAIALASPRMKGSLGRMTFQGKMQQISIGGPKSIFNLLWLGVEHIGSLNMHQKWFQSFLKVSGVPSFSLVFFLLCSS